MARARTGTTRGIENPALLRVHLSARLQAGERFVSYGDERSPDERHDEDDENQSEAAARTSTRRIYGLWPASAAAFSIEDRSHRAPPCSTSGNTLATTMAL
jgi:hypothetical protein